MKKTIRILLCTTALFWAFTFFSWTSDCFGQKNCEVGKGEALFYGLLAAMPFCLVALHLRDKNWYGFAIRGMFILIVGALLALSFRSVWNPASLLRPIAQANRTLEFVFFVIATVKAPIVLGWTSYLAVVCYAVGDVWGWITGRVNAQRKDS